jgi:hypothetical protein
VLAKNAVHASVDIAIKECMLNAREVCRSLSRCSFFISSFRCRSLRPCVAASDVCRRRAH